jgi:hypothetical protein
MAEEAVAPKTEARIAPQYQHIHLFPEYSRYFQDARPANDFWEAITGAYGMGEITNNDEVLKKFVSLIPRNHCSPAFKVYVTQKNDLSGLSPSFSASTDFKANPLLVIGKDSACLFSESIHSFAVHQHVFYAAYAGMADELPRLPVHKDSTALLNDDVLNTTAVLCEFVYGVFVHLENNWRKERLTHSEDEEVLFPKLPRFSGITILRGFLLKPFAEDIKTFLIRQAVTHTKSLLDLHEDEVTPAEAPSTARIAPKSELPYTPFLSLYTGGF